MADQKVAEKAPGIEPAFLTPPQYAARYGVGLNSITELVRQGRLEHFRIGTRRGLRIKDMPPRPLDQAAE